MMVAAALPRTPGIYAIRCEVTGMRYVGSAIHIYRRWLRHVCDLRRGTHYNKALRVAWNIHGEESFTVDVVELIDDKSRLADREQFWLDELRAADPAFGYNATSTAVVGALGSSQTPEARRKRSLALKGRPRPQHVKDAVRQFQTGRKASLETRQKQSALRKGGRLISAETRRKMADGQRGKPKSEKLRAAIRAAHPPMCSEGQVQEMIRLFADGMSLTRIGRHVSVGYMTVARSFARANFHYRPTLSNSQ